jgi:hypothetical protein
MVVRENPGVHHGVPATSTAGIFSTSYAREALEEPRRASYGQDTWKGKQSSRKRLM